MRWRKATWAIVIWTALCSYWLLDSLLIDPPPAVERYGVFTLALTALALLFIWSVGLLVLTIIWRLSRPKASTYVYGPQGQWMTVSEKEARRRVEQEGWSYQPPSPYLAHPYHGQPSRYRDSPWSPSPGPDPGVGHVTRDRLG